MSQAAKLVIEVKAGLLPGEPMPGWGKRFVLTEDEIYDPDAWARVHGAAMFQTMLYQNPELANWVTLEWTWL